MSTTFCVGSSSKISDEVPTNVRLQVRYVLHAIFAVHSLFDSYNTALENDFATAGILDAFEVDHARVSSAGILHSQLPIPLSLGLSIANVTAWGTKIAEVAALWSAALDAAPAVKNAIFGNAADNSQQLPLLVTKPLADSANSLLAGALHLVMSNISTFMDFTSEGRFTTIDTYPNIPSDPGFDISTGLHTFVLSKLMQSDTYYAIPMEVDDRTTFESMSAKDQGKYYYWSPSTHRIY
ncbi:MAG: hypothetical protein L6R42_010703 [Xanthoria sp. 1 TBL-2021]|nr:MAG: hypothetical protein L6R42_010703 [Xanthoria sp. 1 TBL-2021]